MAAGVLPSPTVNNETVKGALTIGVTPQVFPGSGQLVGTTDAQTLTNKNIDGSEITTGTVDSARLPIALTSAIGGIKANAGSAGQFVSGVAADGSLVYSTPAGSGNVNGSGTSVVGNIPSLSNTTTTGIVDSGVSIAALNHPAQGRITLVSGQPVITSTQLADGTIYYTPYNGNYVPIWNGTSFVEMPFTEISQALTDTVNSPAAAVASSAYDLYVWNKGGTIVLSRGPAWSSSLAPATRGAAADIVRQNGIYVNAASITNGPAAGYGTFVGTIRTNTTATVDAVLGGAGSGATGGSYVVWGIWNNYNRVRTTIFNYDTGPSYTYTSMTIRLARGSTNNIIRFVQGAVEDTATAFYQQNITTVAASSAHTVFGIVFNPFTLGYNFDCGNEVANVGATAVTQGAVCETGRQPELGLNDFAMSEQGDGTNANNICVFGGAYLRVTFSE